MRDEGVDEGFDLRAELVRWGTGAASSGVGLRGEGLVDFGAREGAELGGEVGEVGGGLELDFAVFGVHGWGGGAVRPREEEEGRKEGCVVRRLLFRGIDRVEA